MHVYSSTEYKPARTHVCAVATVTMLKHCRYGVKHKTINHKMLVTGF